MPMHRLRLLHAALGVAILVSSGDAFQAGKEPFDVKAHYVKSEQMIPMRDGVKLFTIVYSPKDTSQKYPILLRRTPYSIGPYGGDAYHRQLGPSPNSTGTATSSCTRTCAGNSSPRVSSSHAPARRQKRAEGRPTRAPTPTTPSSGC